MAVTTNTIRGGAVTNLFIFGLIGCSNTPAPWTQENESPWGAKHEAQKNQAASDEAVTDTSLEDPVLLADPDVEAIVMDAPEAAPEPEMIVPVVVEDAPVNKDIMAMLSTNYAVQVFAGNTLESVERFKSQKDVTDLMTVKTDRSGSIVYVLVDVYPDRATADAAAAELEIKTGSKPWVRSLAGLQDIAVQ